MAKFLALCEEYDPNNDTNPKWVLIDFLKSKGINVSIVRNTDNLYIDTGEETIPITVLNSDTEEEAESIINPNSDPKSTSDDVNSEVENLASLDPNKMSGLAKKVFTPNVQSAQQAVQQRQNVSKQAIGAYTKKTQQLQNNLRNVQ